MIVAPRLRSGGSFSFPPREEGPRGRGLLPRLPAAPTPPGPPFVRGGKGRVAPRAFPLLTKGAPSFSPPYEGGVRGGSVPARRCARPCRKNPSLPAKGGGTREPWGAAPLWPTRAAGSVDGMSRSSPPPASPPRARRIVQGVLRWAVVLAGLAIAALAYVLGLLPAVLMVLLAAGAVWGLVARGVAAFRGSLTLAPWRRPLDPALRPVRLQALNRALFWAAAGLMLIWIMPTALMDPGDGPTLIGLLAVVTALDVVLALVPAGGVVRPAWNALPLLGWLFLGTEALRILAGPPGPAVELAAPFDGEWAVGQGGRSALVNHHYPVPGQSHALDLVKLEDGRACLGDPQRLESYPAFGALLRAPAGGRVVRAVDGNPDMAIGQTDEASLVGNHVVIEIGRDRHVLLAHLQRGSVVVSQGQVVRAADPLGRCGNSGNTSQPHLHLQVQSRPDFRAPDLRTYPIVFRGARLARGQVTATGSPRRNDRIIVPLDGASPRTAEVGAGPRAGAAAYGRTAVW